MLLGNISNAMAQSIHVKNLKPLPTQTTVTAVTANHSRMRETHFVNAVRGCTIPLEPGDTKVAADGEAAANFVVAGITSSRRLPTSSLGYWFPYIVIQ